MLPTVLSSLMLISLVACGPATYEGETGDPVSHAPWTALLQKHVAKDGLVDYQGFVRDSVPLKDYLATLSDNHPGPGWSDAETMAFWINAYNAFTVKLIVDHYPVNSIKDIKRGIPFVNTVWDVRFIEIGDATYDLNTIEHGILRKDFDDARIHAAINCASISCPVLRNEAFVASRLDAQLDDATRRFINDPVRNRVTRDKGELSAIFNWFGGDFKAHSGSIREFVNTYADTPMKPDAPITYLDYDWALNNVRR